MKKIYTAQYETPVGKLLLGEYDGKLCLCDWIVDGHRDAADRHIKRYIGAEYQDETTPVIELAINQLDEYFRGSRHTFDVPLLFIGTDFQRTVRQALTEIPYGTTISYSELAKRAGNPKAVRAAAAANAINPVSILVPCHRVIGRDGSMTGYSGGLPAKEYLLKLETGNKK